MGFERTMKKYWWVLVLGLGYFAWQGGYFATIGSGGNGSGFGGAPVQTHDCQVATANVYDARDALNPATALTEAYSFYKDGTLSGATTATTFARAGDVYQYAVSADGYYNQSSSFTTQCGGIEVAPRMVKNSTGTITLLNDDGVTTNAMTAAGRQAIGTGASANMELRMQASTANGEYGARECLQKAGYGYIVTVVTNSTAYDISKFGLQSKQGYAVSEFGGTPTIATNYTTFAAISTPTSRTWKVAHVIPTNGRDDFILTVAAASTIDPDFAQSGNYSIEFNDCAPYSNTISKVIEYGVQDDVGTDIGSTAAIQRVGFIS
jgi:hypothetical protein